MNAKHVKLILLLAVLILCAAPSLAYAQEPVTLSSLVIRVWPEYDRRAALVFYSGEVAPATSLPVEVSFTLPPGAALNAVAYADPDTGELFNAQHTQEGDVLTMTTPTGAFHVEFYDSALQFDGSRRSYTLNASPGYAVESLTWEVQQPIGASSLQAEPGGGDVRTGQFGIAYYTVTQSGVDADETVTVTFTYEKTDDTLTASWLQQQSSLSPGDAGSAPQPTAGGTTSQTWLIIILVVGGLALIGGGVYFFARMGMPLPRPAPSGKSGKRFCTQCGKPVGGGDQFCRHCGARLRK